MQKNLLRALLGAQDLTVEQLREKDPALADAVLALVRSAETTRLGEALAGMPEHLRVKIDEIDFTRATGDVVEHLWMKLIELEIDGALAKQVVHHAENVKLGRGLDPQQVIGTERAIAQQIATARVHEISSVAGLSDAAADAIAHAAPAPSALDEAMLIKLVSEQKLTVSQAHDVGFSAALYQLVDEDTALASAIRSASFPQLGGKAPASTTDLAKLRPTDWTSVVTSRKTAHSANVGPEELGAALAARFAALHPGVALSARLPSVDGDKLAGALTDLDPLFRQNPKVVGGRFEDLDTGGLDPSQIAKLQTTYRGLVQLARAYPGLELATVLDDVTLDAAARVTTVARRIGLFQKVGAALGESPVLDFDLSAESPDLAKLGLGELGATADEQRMVLSTLRAYQRTWAVAQNVDDTHKLVGTGFTSAMSIGTQPFAEFQARAGFATARAKSLWDSARTSMASVTMTATAALDLSYGMFDQLGVGNQGPSAKEYLEKLPGFQDLFGSVSFCDCDECQSILGPAAYFVDLMRYIDENLRPVFATHPKHPLDLKTRRPDLWTLELSCKNTSERNPTLDIIDEILENYIALRLPGYKGSLNDRAAIGNLVYRDTLPQVVDSFTQPFHLPLSRIGSYLAKLGHTRVEVADAVAASSLARAQAELGLSARELQLVTTPQADLAQVSHVYNGMTFGGTAKVDAQQLGPAMGLARDELGQLVGTGFVAAGGAHVTIDAAKRDAKTSVQNDVEVVHGLTADALDRMHRFTRLVRKTGWSILDLDLVLSTLGDSTLGGSAQVEVIAQMHAAQARLGISVAEQCALVGAIPQIPAGKSLFDRLFNPPSVVAAGQSWLPSPSPLPRFFHPAFRQSTSAPLDPTLPRLLSGLSVDLDGLEALARHLASHLAQEVTTSFDPGASDETARYFVLSTANLTLLYRHTRLAQLLHVSIKDLFQLVGFLDLGHVKGLADLRALLDLHTWWRQSGYRLDDVAVALGQSPRDTTRYPDAATIANQVVLSAAVTLTFTDTVFAVTLGTTEQGSRDLLARNTPGIFESPVNGAWRLKAGLDLDTPAIVDIPPTAIVPTPPAGTQAVTDKEARDALRPYLASAVLAGTLGKVFSFAIDKVVALAKLAGQSLTAPAVVRAVRGDVPLNIAPLTTLVSAIQPLAVILSAPEWDAAAVGFLGLFPELFGVEPLPQSAPDAHHLRAPFVSLAQLRALSTYARLTNRRLAAVPGGALPDVRAVVSADLRNILKAFSATGFPSDLDATMARVLGVPAGLVVGLRGPVMLPVSSVAALDQLDQAAQLATAIGVDGETLGALVSDDSSPASYDRLSHAADALVAVLGARIADEKTRAVTLDEAEQPIRDAKRDALADYLIHSITPKVWGKLDDLYQYFLIDVEAGGCSTTSRVVAATMSAQMYVYRAIMNLEQSESGDVQVSFKPDPDVNDDPAAEWEWRKNYRVWQANRKVFLWPENYLEPDLRDDKSPLFKELEQELLQTDISDQNVLDAYTKYLAGFEEVASLTIAGAYHDVRHIRPTIHLRTDSSPAKDAPPTKAPARVTDVLHLFGATATDPPMYYYRTCENLIASGRDVNTAAVWSPWQKINVQITGRKVSPVVHEGRLHVFWTDIKTRSNNKVENGSSTFVGYKHTMSLKFTTLRQDGTWTAPQDVQLPGDFGGVKFGPARGQIMDPLSKGGVAKFDLQGRHQTEAIDDYTLSGPTWDWVWLHSSSQLEIHFRNFEERAYVDLFGRKTEELADTFSAFWAKPSLPPQLLSTKYGSAAAAAAKAVAEARAADDAAATAASRAADFVAALKAAKGNAEQIAAATKKYGNAPAAADKLDKEAAKKTAAALIAVASAARSTAIDKPLWLGKSPWMFTWSNSAFANLVIEEERLDYFDIERGAWKAEFQKDGLYGEQIAMLPARTELLALPGSDEDAVLQIGNDVLLLQGSVTDDAGYVLRRLGTTLVTDIARRLFEDGLDEVLDTRTQFALAEAGLPIKLVGTRITTTSFNGALPLHKGKLDFTGPYGVYYRELFFHIPFLIANALNSRGRFDSAQRWYHYIFDPTSPDTTNIDLNGVKPAEKAHRLLDRVWRYREFRGLGIEHVRDMLTSVDAIAQYEKDPFNPWAIARLRTSAFQKAIVIKYVDNLLDWADSLFTQFTMESVNEAMMLYVMASDILGTRPTKLADCGAGARPITYADIGPQLDESSEILVELETWSQGARMSKAPSLAAERTAPKARYAIDHTAIVHAVQKAPLPTSQPYAEAAGDAATAASVANATQLSPSAAMFGGFGWNQMRTASWGPALGSATTRTSDKLGGRRLDHAKKGAFSERSAGHGWSVLRQQLITQVQPIAQEQSALDGLRVAQFSQAPTMAGGSRQMQPAPQASSAFCVPLNADLLAYWDRVTDRLYKIRNCMDIDGQKRELSLFAPPIDPMQLVAMKAAGLSLDDVLGGTSGNLPPYRFLYLVEKAKTFAGTLAGFGSALLSSLEKKDGEELNRLRLTQQMNLMRLTTQTRQLEITAATESLEALNRQVAAAQRRSDYYAGLIEQGRNTWETAESLARHTASATHGGVATLAFLMGVLGLVPQVGSPFAMKFGGVEMYHNMDGNVSGATALAAVAEGIAASASLEANFERRSEGWTEQKNVAHDEVKVLERQLLAAQIHLDIANRALDLHQKSIDQAEEMLDLTDGKFTNHGLYTWMSTQLQRLYRGAYQNAFAMMKLAEQAYRFERGDDTSPKLAMTYWDPTHAGLLAGEQLLIDLQTLERRFIETNYRTLEVEQSFALTQLDPAALLTLRETGSCQFSIPEVFFDLAYPGHYRRQIKAVRVTIPCVTGPYTNVGATLTLQDSQMRAKPGDALLTTVPPQRTISIATSRAQNDAGVFELSFHDERYMPFEGAGAASTWKLELPASFRPFDYQTISDVVLTINYTALADGALRQKVEKQSAQAEGAIAKYLSENSLGRLFSLRQEFPMAYKGLVASPPGTSVSFEILDWHFPAFMSAGGRKIQVTLAKLALKTVAGVDASGVNLTVDGNAAQGFAADGGVGGLLATADLKAEFSSVLGKHTLTVSAPGALAPGVPQVGDLSAIDGKKLVDVQIYLEYGLVPPV